MFVTSYLKPLVRDLFRNFLETLRAIPPMRFDLNRIHASTAQIVAAIGFAWIVSLILHAWLSWPIGGIDQYALMGAMAMQFGSLAGLTLGALLVFRGALASRLIIAVVLAGLPGSIVIILLFTSYTVVPGVAFTILSFILVFSLPVLVILRGLGTRSFPGALRGLPTLAIYGTVTLWVMTVIPTGYLFLPAGFDETETEAAYNQVDVESLYYAQPGLMEAQLSGLRSQTPGTSDLYALLGSGYAYQSVFLSEVEKVSQLLSDQHGSDRRTIILANSAPHPTRYPMLNRHNLGDALVAIGAAMDPDEDVALLFLTSHGGENLLTLGFYEAGLENLRADELASLLDKSGIRNAVIVVSACHSGSFVDELAGPTRMVVTAAATDRNSFGCADGADWTRFGEAYFHMALRQTRDFREAFQTARATIETWEQESGQTSSLPQISVGADFDEILDRYLAVDLTQRD